MYLRPIYNLRLSQSAARRFLASVNSQRCESTAPATLSEEKEKLQNLLKEDLPKPYDGPERDLVNFPRQKRLEYPGKVRMGFLPEEWFQFFYRKTGVTGPYVFGTGFITYLLSKELWVIEDEFSTGVTLALMAYFAIKKFGPATREYANNSRLQKEKEFVDEKEEVMKNLEDAITTEKTMQWQATGQNVLMDAKRENVQIQLETEYRRRLMNVFQQVKRRLDYQLDMYNTQRKLEQKHMVDWIVNSVVKSITPQQEKEALQKCIEDLKVLSTHAN